MHVQLSVNNTRTPTSANLSDLLVLDEITGLTVKESSGNKTQDGIQTFRKSFLQGNHRYFGLLWSMCQNVFPMFPSGRVTAELAYHGKPGHPPLPWLPFNAFFSCGSHCLPFDFQHLSWLSVLLGHACSDPVPQTVLGGPSVLLITYISLFHED